ncbi:hypothetical protein [Pontibacter akesuensis]|uniref:hypothetical protein n=1 Tax=Pontibacter akesuensis TaxID=388950 RepID=UPI0011140CD0|nr:hypothetical protein [Pontibacter akesuensis]
MNESPKHVYSAIVAAAVLLSIFTAVLAYIITVEASYSSDWKETRNFNLTVDTCDEAKSKAENDFERGLVRMYFSSGVLEEHQNGFPYNFYNRLESEYNIEVIYTGDVGNSLHKCYNLMMDDLLDEKLGKHTIEDLFNKLRDEEYVQ